MVLWCVMIRKEKKIILFSWLVYPGQTKRHELMGMVVFLELCSQSTIVEHIELPSTY